MSLETMTKLNSTTIGAGGSTTITFSNIPQTYTDLVVKFSSRISSNGEGYPVIRFNGDTGSNYSFRNVRGDGASASTGNGTTTYINLYAIPGTLYTTNIFGSIDIYISNYSGNTFKSINAESTTENNNVTSYNALVSGLWSNSSAITSLTLTTQSANETFSQYTTATLYGVKNAAKTAGNSVKATGGNIVFDGTYVYHVFSTAGSFTPTQSMNADVLVVAGGGGAGYFYGGGGGGGGLRQLSLQPLTAGSSYTVTIGSGGAGSGSASNKGSTGTNSSFGTISTSGGGGGGSNSNTSGLSGGSGGGASGTGTAGSGNAGGYSPAEGYDGYSFNSSSKSGGGGGAGGAATTNNGADGTSAYSSWGLATSTGENLSGVYWYAGGGAGYDNATGGSGGGGGSNKSYYSSPANTGGGGGSDGGNGGSGIVIVRYKG